MCVFQKLILYIVEKKGVRCNHIIRGLPVNQKLVNFMVLIKVQVLGCKLNIFVIIQ